MALPRIPRRWRLRTLMIVVALSAAILCAYRECVERGPVYQLMWQLRAGDDEARSEAAWQLGLMGPRAAIAAGALANALGDVARGVRKEAMYALVRFGSQSPRLLPVLVAEIEEPPIIWYEGLPRFVPANGILIINNEPIAALKRIRPDAAVIMPMLDRALKHPDRWMRRRAMEALDAVATSSDPSSPEQAEVLLAALTDARADEDPEIRSRAARVLMRFGGDIGPTEPALHAALSHTSSSGTSVSESTVGFASPIASEPSKSAR